LIFLRFDKTSEDDAYQCLPFISFTYTLGFCILILCRGKKMVYELRGVVFMTTGMMQRGIIVSIRSTFCHLSFLLFSLC